MEQITKEHNSKRTLLQKLGGYAVNVAGLSMIGGLALSFAQLPFAIHASNKIALRERETQIEYLARQQIIDERSQSKIMYPSTVGCNEFNYAQFADMDGDGRWDVLGRHQGGQLTDLVYKNGYGPQQALPSSVSVRFVEPDFFSPFERNEYVATTTGVEKAVTYGNNN